jgi:hypothetical protein
VLQSCGLLNLQGGSSLGQGLNPTQYSAHAWGASRGL